MIAINQDITPQGTPVAPGDSRVWSRKLSDGSTAYALVNLQVFDLSHPQLCTRYGGMHLLDMRLCGFGQDVNITIPTKVLTSSHAGKTMATGRVHELWANVSYTIADLPKTVTVEPHATVLYRVYPSVLTSTVEVASATE